MRKTFQMGISANVQKPHREGYKPFYTVLLDEEKRELQFIFMTDDFEKSLEKVSRATLLTLIEGGDEVPSGLLKHVKEAFDKIQRMYETDESVKDCLLAVNGLFNGIDFETAIFSADFVFTLVDFMNETKSINMTIFEERYTQFETETFAFNMLMSNVHKRVEQLEEIDNLKRLKSELEAETSEDSSLDNLAEELSEDFLELLEGFAQYVKEKQKFVKEKQKERNNE